MTNQMPKKRVLAKAALLYLVFCLLSGGIWLLSLSQCLPGWLAGVIGLVYALLGLTALSHRHTLGLRAGKAIAAFGQYWFSLQLSLFFPALPLLAGQVLLVWILRVLSAQAYARVCLGVLCAVLLLDVYGWIHARHIRVRRFAHTVDKPVGSPSTLRIVHLSDLHLGPVTGLRAVQKIVRKVNTLSADLVCITGDTFTEDIRGVYDADAIAEALRGIRSSFGVYGCLGNHDAGPQLPDMLAFFKQAGITILCDATATPGGRLVLAGRSDYSPAGRRNPERPSLEAVLAGADMRLPVVVMDHQPAALTAARDAGADLLLCGHTHGGQFFPIHLMVRRFFPHYYGPKAMDRLLVLVSPGTYTATPPLRIGSRSEIFVVELASGASVHAP